MPILTLWQNGRSQEIPFDGQPVLSQVLEGAGLAVAHPCGGRGTCGKCAVELRGAVSPPNEAEKLAGQRLSCQAALLGDCEALLPQAAALEQIESALGPLQTRPGARPMAGEWGAAVDIGTTTLALKLYHQPRGLCLGEATALNPQTAVAADVMGRIGAALEGQGPRLREQIAQALDRLLQEACGQAKIQPLEVEAWVLAGNTTMLYLLTGRNPESLSHAPFKADCLFDLWEDLLGRRAYLPPCLNAFVGADITCALLASGLCEKPETALLCDIGTNGEIALWKEGRLFVTSTAAGPAFEGAGISCGCGSVRGAIDKVWVENGRLGAHTIGEAPAVGICGSGLLDAVAALLETGEIDETGATEEERLPLRDGVALLPKDIRAVQLAKAAIAAGIGTLLEEAGVSPGEIGTLYIAGGFGSHLRVASAAAIGLIPRELASKAKVIGNASLAGAALLLLDERRVQEARAIAAAASHVSLGGNPRFNERYMEEMLFPAQE